MREIIEDVYKWIRRKEKGYFAVNMNRMRVVVIELLCCSMNPKMDLGQVEGAFVMGLGYFLTEKIEFDLETGEPKTINTWVGKILAQNKFSYCNQLHLKGSNYNSKQCFPLFQTYKPPSSKDIPIDFRVELLRNAPNPSGILGSKGKQIHCTWLPELKNENISFKLNQLLGNRH